MNNLKRQNCVISGTSKLNDLFTYKDFPAFIGCTDQDKEHDIKSDLRIIISEPYGILQVERLLPLEVVYSGFHSEAIGPTWDEHHIEFSNFVLDNKSGNDVIEMGGSDCRLAYNCLEKDKLINWTVVEPNPTKDSDKNVKIERGFIEDNLYLLNSCKNFVHSHVLEHLYDPVKTLHKISESQQIGDKIIFSVPNIEFYLKNKFINTLNFEHTYYFNDSIIDYMMSTNNYKIVNKTKFKDHSCFYCYQKVQNSTILNLPSDYNTNKELYLDVIKYYNKQVNEINSIIEKHDSDCFIFGAHVFTQYLVNLGLNQRKIKFILDNSQIKSGKRLYGSDLHVKNPSVIQDSSNPLVILKVGQYFEEIKEQLCNINKNVKLVT